MSALLTRAYDKNGKLVHIDSVLNGSACNCTCPECKNPLVAKNGGNEREHHFAHSHGFLCESSDETLLHFLAKEILMKEQCIMLPNTEDNALPSGLVQLHDVKTETWDNQYGFKPDAEAIMENGERLLIEFYVSHKITKKKRDVIVENNLKCLEIDLNFVQLDENEIRDFLIKNNDGRKWVTRLEEKKKCEGESYSERTRNEWQQKAIEEIKKCVDSKSLYIGFWYDTFNLTEKGYDICEANSSLYRGFKSDLLLYRSTKKDKGYIAISIRGRRRNDGHVIPQNLRVIDIIIRDKLGYNRFLEHNVLKNDDLHVVFEGFKEKIMKNQHNFIPMPRYSNYYSYNQIPMASDSWDDDWERIIKQMNK